MFFLATFQPRGAEGLLSTSLQRRAISLVNLSPRTAQGTDPTASAQRRAGSMTHGSWGRSTFPSPELFKTSCKRLSPPIPGMITTG